MTPQQIIHAKRINSRPQDVVADYIMRRGTDSVDVAIEETADYWGIEVQALAVYLRSRVTQDSEALKNWLPFLWMRSDEA